MSISATGVLYERTAVHQSSGYLHGEKGNLTRRAVSVHPPSLIRLDSRPGHGRLGRRLPKPHSVCFGDGDHSAETAYRGVGSEYNVQ